MPDAAVIERDAGSPPPPRYGLAIIFNAACAGHLERVPIDPDNVQSPPIGCFDDAGAQLGPNDYVLGVTRVYAYETLTNSNPIIDRIEVREPDGGLETFSGSVDAERDAGGGMGLTVHPCSNDGCSTYGIRPVVPADSQEPNPLAHSVMGPAKEQIWAAFYSDVGSFDHEVRLLYDSFQGAVGEATETDAGAPATRVDEAFHAPGAAGDGTIWVVVHDDRGGVSWVTLPVHVASDD
ncbi:MAG: hypothetical protein JOZ69_24250 [Myxococcales bacterium]|nr:hypothetical protein [Myxococcales bacterium]